ncbi:hypothetical protein FRB93_005783 [Tulasnella sp. JGI-2019a]|nr:hypothetical protein FRB93_005783 [Tulasnella sp. JGI-2019a]
MQKRFPTSSSISILQAMISLLAVIICPLLVSTVPAPAPTSPPTRTFQKRDLASAFSSAVAALPSDVFHHVLSGTLDLPGGGEVEKELGLNDTQVSQLPLSFLDIPTYGNWTGTVWNLRIHGAAYKQAMPSNDTLDSTANKFISNIPMSSYNQSMYDQSRNMSGAFYVIPQGNVTLGIQGYINGTEVLNVTYPFMTTEVGEVEGLVQVNTSDLVKPGAGKLVPQLVQLYSNNTLLSNSTGYLVSDSGTTAIFDIDDILRFTQIYVPKAGLDNSFAYPFRPWDNMPEVLANWAKTDPTTHFHYLTTTPEQFTRIYMDFIFKYYPLGSFDIRPFNFTTVDQTFSIRRVNLIRVFETFPQRKFVLVADTSNSDVMQDYPEMATLFPGQVSCILLRNTSASDQDMKFPYNTTGFKNLDNSTYMFFRTAEDLQGIDFWNGGCRNASVPQNVTFEYQQIPSAGDIKTILGNGGTGVEVKVRVGALALSILAGVLLLI